MKNENSDGKIKHSKEAIQVSKADLNSLHILNMQEKMYDMDIKIGLVLLFSVLSFLISCMQSCIS